MKILCISDQVDPQVYSPLIKERFSKIDMILSAGDLPMDYIDYIVSTLNKPLLLVFGNHDTEDLKNYSQMRSSPFYGEYQNDFQGCGAVYLDTKIVRENNLIITGLGGCMRYNYGLNQFTDFQMYLEIIKLIPGLIWNRIVHGRFCDILLTHAPPKGIHDKKDKCHTGFKSFLWFMKVFKPKYLVHGHIHIYDLNDERVTTWNDTTVINAYSHCVIDLGEYKC